MRISLAALAIVVFLAPAWPSAQDKNDNPFRNAKVGDYITFRQTITFLGMDIVINVKETVSAKNDKELKLKITADVKGKSLPDAETTVDLTKPYDPAMPPRPKATFVKTGEGKEKVTLAGKTFDCIWIAGKLTTEFGGAKTESDLKYWVSKAVPLTGMVKLESKNNRGEQIRTELTGFGSAK